MTQGPASPAIPAPLPLPPLPRRPQGKRALESGIAAPAIITVPEKRFSEDLMWEDRVRLRAIVQKTHRFLFAADASNAHVDRVIDVLGPEVRNRMLMKALAAGKVA